MKRAKFPPHVRSRGKLGSNDGAANAEKIHLVLESQNEENTTSGVEKVTCYVTFPLEQR